MNFTYKIGSRATTYAIKKAESQFVKTIEKQTQWAYVYFNKYWNMGFTRYCLDFKKKFKVKNIRNDSFLYNLLKVQYLAYKVYLTFSNDKSYDAYLNCIKDTAKDLNNMKGE